MRRLLYVRRGMTSYVGLASRHLASFSRSLSPSRAAAKVLWRFVHPQLRLCQAGGPSATPFPGSELAGTLEVRTHTRLDTLAGKESSTGGGAAINAGPIGTGGRGSAPRLGAAWSGPGARASRPLSAATTLSVPGEVSASCSGSGKPAADPPHVVCSGSSGPVGLPQPPRLGPAWGRRARPGATGVSIPRDGRGSRSPRRASPSARAPLGPLPPASCACAVRQELP